MKEAVELFEATRSILERIELDLLGRGEFSAMSFGLSTKLVASHVENPSTFEIHKRFAFTAFFNLGYDGAKGDSCGRGAPEDRFAKVKKQITVVLNDVFDR